MDLNIHHSSADLEERLRFETLLADLSSKFVNLPAGEVDSEIMHAQRRIGELLELDLLILWQVSDEHPGYYLVTHFYSAQKGAQPSQFLKEEDYPWFKQEMVAGRIAFFTSLDELPREASRDRESFIQLGIKSNLCCPLAVGGESLIGAFSLNATRSEYHWPDALVKRMQLLAQVFANALARKRAEQALRDSEERMALAADAAEFCVWGWNITSNHVWGSEQWRCLFGFIGDEELSFEDVIQRIHPENRETVEREVRLSLTNGTDYAGEFRAVLPDSTVRWISSRGRGHKDASGKPVRMLGAATDITERKRTEDALRLNEARLKAGADLVNLGCYEINYAEPSCFGDERFGEICGVPPGKQQDLERLQFWMDHLHPDDRQHVLEERQKVYEGKAERYNIEYRYLHPSQGQRWIHHLSSIANRDASGQVARIHGVLRDISERKRLSEQLLSSAAEWQTTFDSISDLIMILDVDYRILRVNAATLRFLGLPMEKIVGCACHILMHGSDCPIDGCPCRKTFETRKGSQLEMFHASSGRWLIFSTYPILDEAGNINGSVHVGRDVTDAKQAEAELHRQREDLAHISRVNTLGALSGSLAHELNQPLGIILSNAQAAQEMLAMESPDLGEVRAILADIVAADQRAGNIILRLRELFKHGHVSLQMLSLNMLIEEVLHLSRADLIGRNVSVDLQLDSDLPPIMGDRVQLQQLVLNLIQNAAEAMATNVPGTRHLFLRTMLHQGLVRASVRDDGIGLPLETECLFQSLYTTKSQGMGMGLTICRSIATAHHGRLWAENHPAGGAVFHFELPIGVSSDTP